MNNREKNPWHAPLSSMVNVRTLIFLGVGLIIGYQIAKRWGKTAQTNQLPPMQPPPMMQGMQGMHGNMGRTSGGFENIADLEQYAPGQAPCTTCDNETAPSQEFEVQ